MTLLGRPSDADVAAGVLPVGHDVGCMSDRMGGHAVWFDRCIAGSSCTVHAPVFAVKRRLSPSDSVVLGRLVATGEVARFCIAVLTGLSHHVTHLATAPLPPLLST